MPLQKNITDTNEQQDQGSRCIYCSGAYYCGVINKERQAHPSWGGVLDWTVLRQLEIEINKRLVPLHAFASYLFVSSFAVCKRMLIA